jgi:hypothetical protein
MLRRWRGGRRVVRFDSTQNENFLASKLVTAAKEHPRLDVAIVNGALVATAL